uniref:uncharacterized protein LOC122593068 isoform X2 n=1 Tax=Erigeron canadensis TaxID=72917 RepID=UPI001CB8A384|nr:uncharacterized protein LOC122593068 isoform X2 [Erigeron canadensis]
MTTTLIPQILTSIATYYKPPTLNPTISSTKRRHLCCCYHNQGLRLCYVPSKRLLSKDGFYGKINNKKKRLVILRSNNLKFNNGGGGKDDDESEKSKVFVNLALAVGLAYLSLTGQLGWILDTIVSVWLFVVLVPLVGLGALIWWASRDMVEIQCRNCGNEFEVFKSMLNDEPRVCPYCSQPFSVVGDEFIRDPATYSKKSTTFDGAFNDLFSQTKKGKASSRAVIDVEAEVKDVD